jgi:pantoate kinase
LRGSKGVGVTIESYGKVEISYINVDNFSMNNDRDIKFDIEIGHH